MTTQSNSSASPNAKEEDVSSMLLLLLSIERDRCMSLPEGDERSSALGDLVDGAPHLMDRIRGSIAEFSKLKQTKSSVRNHPGDSILAQILSNVGGDETFIRTARITEVREHIPGLARIVLEGQVRDASPRYDMSRDITMSLSRNTPFDRVSNRYSDFFHEASPVRYAPSSSVLVDPATVRNSLDVEDPN